MDANGRATAATSSVSITGSGATGGDTLLELDRTMGHLLRRAQQVNTAMWLTEFDGQLTGPQFGLVVSIFYREPLEQSAIGQLVALDRSNAADIISRLVKRGWIVRSRDVDDSRRNKLTLTSGARASVPEMMSRVMDIQEQFMEPLSSTERQWFVGYLALLAFAGKPPNEEDAVVPLRVTSPGHLIRRAEQLHGVYWAEHIGSSITPSQYCLMTGIAYEGLIDQRRAGALASLDRSTTSSVAGRLIRRRLLETQLDEQDNRRSLLRLTGEGWRLLEDVAPAVLEVQHTLLEPLGAEDAGRLTDLLRAVAYRGRSDAAV